MNLNLSNHANGYFLNLEFFGIPSYQVDLLLCTLCLLAADRVLPFCTSNALNTFSLQTKRDPDNGEKCTDFCQYELSVNYKLW